VVLQHTLNVQVLEGYQVGTVNQLSGYLMQELISEVGYPLAYYRKPMLCFLTVGRAFDLSV
jgi:hypothetical protein